MEQAEFAFLLSPVGQQWLATLADARIDERNHLQWASKLRKVVSPEQGQALIETALLRQRAGKKFSRADKMYFDRAGLEMSSAELISTYRSQKYAPFHTVADLGCGIGGDAIGLAQHANVLAVDKEPLKLAMAAENVAAYGQRARFIPHAADLQTMQPLVADALFFDPARRDARGTRIFSLRNYQPSLTILERWQPVTPNWGVKISPGVDLAEIPPEATVEFISVRGELREAVLWYGTLRSDAARTATLLPSGAQLDDAQTPSEPPLYEPRRFLFEPDAAVIRAQLVQHVAGLVNGAMIDRSIAYLTSDNSAESPFATRYEVEAWFPFQLKRLRSYLRERSVGTLTIKKRGSPLEPDQLRKQLKPKGPNQRTIFLTRHNGTPIVIVTV